MIQRLLVANRGEIARRIMATCRRLGIETVAVFSDADASAAFLQDADLSVGIGGNTPAQSYLRIDAILAAAAATGADAVHPGYGFLAENAEFAEAVGAAGLIFVGPPPAAIAAMGSKLEAKELMLAAGVPLLPSADLTDLDAAQTAAAAHEVGYPILVKASAGGGGRGMRIVMAPEDLAEAVEGASREAKSAFGDGTVYAERYVTPSRHVEVQVFGDSSGRVVHFHERECSIQRRHQKIIEEAPSASIDQTTRTALHEAAIRAAGAIDYSNAGTVEFLLAPPDANGHTEFFFLEVNTRLQVEHAVTEAVLGVDLVELQLSVAAGGAVPAQDSIGPVNGHAIEARLYAEDPTEGFRPSTGTVSAFAVPGEVRVDSAIPNGGEVSQFYDPMIAKVVSHAATREAAARSLAASLAGTVIDGIKTNRDLLVRTLRHPEFLGTKGDSEFLARHDPAQLGRPLVEEAELRVYAMAAALGVQEVNRQADQHTQAVATGFRNVATSAQFMSLLAGSQPLEVRYMFKRGVLVEASVDGVALESPVVHGVSATQIDLAVDGVRRQFNVRVLARSVSVATTRGVAWFERVPRFVPPEANAKPGHMVATMPGTIVAVNAKPGDVVEAGATLVVMEAMKMELAITTSVAGVVAELPVSVGDAVQAGAVLAVVSDPET